MRSPFWGTGTPLYESAMKLLRWNEKTTIINCQIGIEYLLTSRLLPTSYNRNDAPGARFDDLACGSVRMCSGEQEPNRCRCTFSDLRWCSGVSDPVCSPRSPYSDSPFLGPRKHAAVFRRGCFSRARFCV